jgi:catechol 2,3-dioxygenase-like lactoylglutathione lyase family enzyme
MIAVWQLPTDKERSTMQITAATLQTTNLADQKRFYTEVLGLPLVSEASDRFTVQAGATVLTWELAAPGTRPHYHFAFNIPENKLAQAKAWLMARHKVLVTDDGEDTFHFVSWNADAIYFHDGAGSGGEFIARHNLPTATDAPFGPEHILSLSEVSLPTSDVAGLSRHLNSLQGWECFPPGSAPSASFDAVGDDYGLLLVARLRRPWLTTGGEAAITPVILTVKGPNPGSYDLPGLPYRIIVE